MFSGIQTTILEMVKVINAGIGRVTQPIFGEQRAGDIPHSNADISKAKNMLGYHPNISFEEGMRKLLE